VVRIEEVVPGEYDVDAGDTTVRVVVPAGVGLPGVDPEELVEHLVAVLQTRGEPLPEVIDVSLLLGSDPTLVAEVERRTDVP
jgi:hypothetical protein